MARPVGIEVVGLPYREADRLLIRAGDEVSEAPERARHPRVTAASATDAPQRAVYVKLPSAWLRRSAAGAVRRLGRATGGALQRHVEGLLLDARYLRCEAQLLQRLDADTDRVGGLADRIRRRDRAVDRRRETADGGDSGEPH
jgi:hypothetical protein